MALPLKRSFILKHQWFGILLSGTFFMKGLGCHFGVFNILENVLIIIFVGQIITLSLRFCDLDNKTILLFLGEGTYGWPMSPGSGCSSESDEVWEDQSSAHSQHGRPRRPPLPSRRHSTSLHSLFALGLAKYLLPHHVDPSSGIRPSSVRFNFFSTCSGKIFFLTKFPLFFSQGKCILSLAPLEIEVNDFSKPFCRF